MKTKYGIMNWCCVVVLIYVLCGCTTNYYENFEETKDNQVSLPDVTPTYQDSLGSIDKDLGTIFLATISKILSIDVNTLDIVDEYYAENGNVISYIAQKNDDIYFSMSTDIYEDNEVVDPIGPNEIFKLNSNKSIEQITFGSFGNRQLSASAMNEMVIIQSDKLDPISNQITYNIVLFDIYDNSEKLIFSSINNLRSKWAPQGDRIAVLEETEQFGSSDQYQHQANLYFWDKASDNVYQVLPGKFLYYENLDWSYDQSKFVVSGREDEKNVIYVVSNQELNILSSIPFENISRNLAWSPIGDYLIFEVKNNNVPDREMKLYLLDFNSNTIKLLHSGEIDGRIQSYNAVWSPDGEYLAYFTNYEDNSKQTLTKMYIYSMHDETICSSLIFDPDHIWKTIWVN